MDDLPSRLLGRVRQHLEAVAADPYGPGTAALHGPFRGVRRLRVGDYRIIYQVRDDQGVVKVLLVANRRDAYEQLERMTR